MNGEDQLTSLFGIASFARVPVHQPDEEWTADAAVIGVPFDGGAGYRPGARFGPQAVREASARSNVFRDARGYWDIETGQMRLEGFRLVDLGDVIPLAIDHAPTFQRTEAMVAQALQRGAMPVIIGGDHSVTAPVFRAVGAAMAARWCDQVPAGFEAQTQVTGAGVSQLPPRHRCLDVVHFDAHLDYRHSNEGRLHGHGSPIRRASEYGWTGQIVSLGIRGPRLSAEDYHAALERGNVIIPCATILDEGVERAASTGARASRSGALRAGLAIASGGGRGAASSPPL